MEYKAKVLVVEDDLGYQERYNNWLSDENYLVKMSGTFKDAERILETHCFDVVVADMNLEDDKQGGMKVLQEIRRIGDSTRAIVISAEPTSKDVRDSQEKFGASVLFKNELDKEKLIRAVDQAVQKAPAHRYGEKSLYKVLLKDKGLADEKIHLISKNEYDLKDLLENTFTEVWPFNIDIPITTKLVEVLGIESMIQVSGWSRAMGSAVVVRLGSRRIIEKESHAYNKHVRELAETVKSLKEGPFYYKDLGGLVYVLSDAKFEPICDFAYFYEKESDSRVLQSTENAFRIGELLHKSRGVDNVNIDLSIVYKKIIEQATKYQKREKRISGSDATGLNPIEFLLKRDFIFENIPVGIVHGDLHNGNIMVNSEAQTRLLGFYLTGESDVIVPKADKSDSVAFRAHQAGKRNLLHDYATLEVSIRRTLATINLKEIEEFDRALCVPRKLSETASPQVDFANPKLKKAYHVITDLRMRVSDLVKFEDDMQVYCSELLFQFIALYLRSIDLAEKDGIYRSAAILAGRLDGG